MTYDEMKSAKLTTLATMAVDTGLSDRTRRQAAEMLLARLQEMRG